MICIRSSVALMLSEAFPNALDSRVRSFLGSLESKLAVPNSYDDDVVISSTDLSLTSRIKSLALDSNP